MAFSVSFVDEKGFILASYKDLPTLPAPGQRVRIFTEKEPGGGLLRRVKMAAGLVASEEYGAAVSCRQGRVVDVMWTCYGENCDFVVLVSDWVEVTDGRFFSEEQAAREGGSL